MTTQPKRPTADIAAEIVDSALFNHQFSPYADRKWVIQAITTALDRERKLCDAALELLDHREKRAMYIDHNDQWCKIDGELERHLDAIRRDAGLEDA